MKAICIYVSWPELTLYLHFQVILKVSLGVEKGQKTPPLTWIFVYFCNIHCRSNCQFLSHHCQIPVERHGHEVTATRMEILTKKAKGKPCPQDSTKTLSK